MKQSKIFIPTLKEVPSDAEIKSHQFLIRAGYVRQSARGIYSYLPLAQTVKNKIEAIVREELAEIGATEILMPVLQPAEIWKESGRWDKYGADLMTMKDRHNRDFALGPTHEEMVTDLLRDDINSYKKLPLTVFQIQTKFRDERRPRFGLLRGREFLMKDAYSFHAETESLDTTFDDMATAYGRILDRCGLEWRSVIADSGAIGGTGSREFQVIADVGEDTIVYDKNSDYAANVEMAEVYYKANPSTEEKLAKEKVATPGMTSIADLVEGLSIPIEKTIKSLLVQADEEIVMVLLRGDHEFNDVKLKNLLDLTVIEMASETAALEVMGAEYGSLGPVNVPADMKIYADSAVQDIVNASVGANETGYHFINVNHGTDFSVETFADLRMVQEGDLTPDGVGTLSFAKGIEVGHIFKLGSLYSEAMKATYLDENGRQQPFIMGCYGLGISRLLAAIIEQTADDKGLVWNKLLAPYHVHLIPIKPADEDQAALTTEIEKLLAENNLTSLIDDRKERPGVKFADSELIGLPVRITVGKRAAEGIVEVKVRATGESFEVETADLLAKINEILN
ncbi:proline--tRNA ligase [Brochothrix thermosphacta]|uniref:proline--tRNA ligase n=1 Tax=Brochothrix thermosphacta TaxID=2756 RepID=UPI00083F935B|nr:proline--tRNA ligase [Brochothrix thermosphacta]ODJ52747.1 proline--tRNA ligase [Brochothrix thermosphacta]ODJ61028.1 proline--tRNA ligase [Brochothrix thermosphacta]